MKNIFKVLLVVLAIVLSFFIYRSISSYVKFNKEKIDRYAIAVEQLQDLALAEKLYKTYTGEYTDNLDSLKHYIENGKIYSITRKDSSAYVFDPKKRIEVMKNFTIIDTIVSPVSVKDSIFKKASSYENFGYVPVNGKKFPIELYASFNDRIIGNDSTNIQRDHFFMGSISKKDVLDGMDPELIQREMKDEQSPIKSEKIKVGSDIRPSLEGNWATEIDVRIKEKKIAETKAKLKN
ncbi:hypothetical protein KRX57_00210 [Weeksellaceae bacterium TAE3-ERU29]|nr:hypothetical protein [Weeksellaceae bacterium TAE3-ERU29]